MLVFGQSPPSILMSTSRLKQILMIDRHKRLPKHEPTMSMNHSFRGRMLFKSLPSIQWYRYPLPSAWTTLRRSTPGKSTAVMIQLPGETPSITLIVSCQHGAIHSRLMSRGSFDECRIAAEQLDTGA